MGSDWTGLFSILYYPHRRTKKVENISPVCHPGHGSQVQTGTENWDRNPMRGFNFVLIRSHAYFPEWKSAFIGLMLPGHL